MKIQTVGDLREALDSYDDSVPLFISDSNLAGAQKLEGPWDFVRWDGRLMARLSLYR